MSVRMDRIARLPLPHGLDLLFHAAVVAADQLDPIEDRSRRQALPELKFLLVEVSQRVRKEVRILKVGDVSRIDAAG
jgi:hypothetical protein